MLTAGDALAKSLAKSQRVTFWSQKNGFGYFFFLLTAGDALSRPGPRTGQEGQLPRAPTYLGPSYNNIILILLMIYNMLIFLFLLFLLSQHQHSFLLLRVLPSSKTTKLHSSDSSPPRLHLLQFVRSSTLICLRLLVSHKGTNFF